MGEGRPEMASVRTEIPGQRLAAAGLYWLAIPAAVVGGGAAVDRALGWGRFPRSAALAVAAAVLLAAGLALIGLSSRDLRVLGEGTPSPADPPKRLVEGGAYALCRHPMFLGYDLAALGVVLLTGSPGTLLAVYPVFLCCEVLFLKRKEEVSLERRFGEQYRAYRRRVPFLAPRLRTRRGPA